MMEKFYIENPTVTIIVPVFNREVLIEETIDSIKNQIYRNFECLLIDDDSTDNTFHVIKQLIGNDKRFKLMKRKQEYPKGPSACRNMGLDIAKGKYIQFFDSDDLMHPNHLRLKIEAYDKHNVDLAVCQLGEFDEDIEKIFSVSYIDDSNELIKHISGEVNYYLPGPLWQKETIGSSRFNTNTRIYEDLLFNIVNRRKCNRVHLINEVLIYYRRHDKSTTGIATQNIELLNEKRKSWKMIYNEMKEFYDKDNRCISQILFQKSCLNLYYFLCQKSIFFSLKQIKDVFSYASTINDYMNALKCLLLSPIVFITKKGYRIYKLKDNKG